MTQLKGTGQASTPVAIDEKRALELLEWVVAERGADYIYEASAGCLYANRGKPSCGVGLALHKAGVPVKVLEELDGPDGGAISYIGVREILEGAGFVLSPGAAIVFGWFQRKQDSGMRYERALDFARTRNA